MFFLGKAAIVDRADPYKNCCIGVLVHAISVLCSSLINTPDVFTMDETNKSVTESEGGSTCASSVNNNGKRGSKTVKSKNKTKLQKSLDTICATFMEVSQADVKR